MADNGVVSNAEDLVSKMAQRLVEVHQTVVGGIGQRQYGQTFVPEKDQARNAGYAFQDDQLWQQIVDQHGPAKAIARYVESLRLKDKDPEEFQYGMEAFGANTPPPPDMQQPQQAPPQQTMGTMMPPPQQQGPMQQQPQMLLQGGM